MCGYICVMNLNKLLHMIREMCFIQYDSYHCRKVE